MRKLRFFAHLQSDRFSGPESLTPLKKRGPSFARPHSRTDASTFSSVCFSVFHSGWTRCSPLVDLSLLWVATSGAQEWRIQVKVCLVHAKKSRTELEVRIVGTPPPGRQGCEPKLTSRPADDDDDDDDDDTHNDHAQQTAAKQTVCIRTGLIQRFRGQGKAANRRIVVLTLVCYTQAPVCARIHGIRRPPSLQAPPSARLPSSHPPTTPSHGDM